MTTDLSGRTLSRKFVLQRSIGVGGMATVYEATNTQLDKRVAVKVLKAQYLDHGTLLIRFQREARNAAQMNHPHIVQVTDFDVDGDIPYIVMEYHVFLLETPGSVGDHVKLLDFGIAKLQQPDDQNREPLTSPSQVPGTPEYMGRKSTSIASLNLPSSGFSFKF